LILRFLFLLCGVFACSTAAIFIRNSSIHPVPLSSLRLFVAAVILAPLFVRDLRQHRETYTAKDLVASLLPGVLLGIHFITWLTAVDLATVANASLIVNLMPIAMPFFMHFLVNERLTGREWLATAMALSATALLIACDFNLDPEYFLGDLVSFISMLFFCSYLALSRRYRHVSSIWLYVVPLYTVAGTFCMVVALVLGSTSFPEMLPRLYPAREWVWVLCLGVVPTIIGHSILNHSMKLMRGQVVSIVNMGQFVFAGTMAYVVFREVPHWSLYVAGALLVPSGIIVAGRKTGPPP